ncbi:MAG TPA: SAM-dependent methyltransferase [Trebonia sp.]
MTGTPPIEPTVDKRILDRLNTKVAHPARVYDYLLGGKDNFAADRETAESFPEKTAQAARANRAFLARAVTFLTQEAGIRQFLDVGTGLPTANNTHEVAQRIARDSRVVYVDNDPMVLLHAKTLLTSTDTGKTSYIDADLRDPQTILSHAAEVLDFTQPVALMLISILHFLKDEERPYEIVRAFLDAFPPGSYLAITHLAGDTNPDGAEVSRRFNERSSSQTRPRTRAECAEFFDGLELVDPGLVPWSQWRPRSELEAAAQAMGWAGVGKKP